MSKEKLVFIVEDDSAIRELESYALKNSGFDVVSFEEPKEFAKELERRIPDLLILDIMLPGEDGISVLKKLRVQERTKNLPIIMVTAKSTEIDAVKGLDAGADDYICKPFGVMELVSRVKALLRRTEKEEKHIFEFNGIELDENKHNVLSDGDPIELTYKEYQILKYLLINKGLVLTRDKLMDLVWGYDFEQGNRTVDVHILSLRKKLGKNGDAIKTIRNVGYKIGD